MVYIPCYHPLIAEIDYVRGVHDEAQKVLKFISYPMTLDSAFDSNNHLLIPCGQCVGCRLDYSREWANRMMMELDSHKSSYFLTLTYNDEHLPLSAIPSTGEVTSTLRKRDVQLFMKRLRFHFSEQKIRFYASGEYGDTTFRPHYHLIVFGLQLDENELNFYKYQKLDNGRVIKYYTSPTLEKIWGQGFVVVSEVTWETCAYTARYVMKKLKGEAASFYDELGIEPPFSLMSRKPGLGAQYYYDHPDLYQDKLIRMATANGAKEFVPPKYIDNLFKEEFPYEFDVIQENRMTAAQDKVRAKLAQTSLNYSELLEVEEASLKEKLKVLRRNVN